MNESKGHILLVDDEPISANLLAQLLKKNGFDVSVAQSGEECIKEIDDSAPQLILLDIVMPGISGIGVLKYLREKYQPIELPVIMLTAKDEVSDIIEALKLGANDYITKPANIDIAMARINTQLALQQYYKDSVRTKELETVNAMMVTYNHEINTPLTIAIASLYKARKSHEDKAYDKIEESLDRITEIVRKMKETSERQHIETVDYGTGSKMFKV